MDYYEEDESFKVFSNAFELEKKLSSLGNVKSLRVLGVINKVIREEKDKGLKGKNHTSYYYHLVCAAQLLLNSGVNDDGAIASALLMELVKDIEWITYEYIENEYGDKVVRNVRMCNQPN